MTMPRLSLYRPEKGNDYKFIDKNIWEMFQVGGVDVLIHKYLGPGSSSEATPSTPGYTSTTETQIQDLLFLENRDRKYDPDVYILRGVYNIQDTDFNLSQFGLFLQNDTVFISFHINDTVEKIGRKLMAGDVIELPHLKDEFALNDLQFALKRFYVIEEISRASEGFSVTWYPHLYRAKCKPLVDSQEYKEILDGVAGEGSNLTLRDVMSTYEKEMQITQAVLDQAETDAPKSGYDTSRYYHLQKDTDGNAALVTVDNDTYPTYDQYTSMVPGTVDINGVPTGPHATNEKGIFQYEESIWAETPLYIVGDIFSYDATNTDQRNAKVYTVIKNVPAELLKNPTIPSIEYYSEGNSATPIWAGTTASALNLPHDGKYYDGYITEDGIPANGAPFSAGIAFPVNPTPGQYCLRKDYLPNRLFRFNGTRWAKIEDIARMTMSNLGTDDVLSGQRFEGKDVRLNQKGSFINNDASAKIDGRTVQEKQGLSKALRPKADE
jgi:hypothetical protein